MPVSITANTSARYAQSSLIQQSAAVTKGTLKMSTGQRVLSAADDAAALAIGTSLKIENSGLKSAILNATSGTSMLQIADGALGQIAELMTRLQSLATQASSGQYDDPTRAHLRHVRFTRDAGIRTAAQTARPAALPQHAGGPAWGLSANLCHRLRVD